MWRSRWRLRAMIDPHLVRPPPTFAHARDLNECQRQIEPAAGLEPATPCLQDKCAANCATPASRRGRGEDGRKRTRQTRVASKPRAQQTPAAATRPGDRRSPARPTGRARGTKAAARTWAPGIPELCLSGRAPEVCRAADHTRHERPRGLPTGPFVTLDSRSRDSILSQAAGAAGRRRSGWRCSRSPCWLRTAPPSRP